MNNTQSFDRLESIFEDLGDVNKERMLSSHYLTLRIFGVILAFFFHTS